MKFHNARGLSVRLVATAEYSKWPSSGEKEIELVIAPALVSDALAKDYDPQLQLPDFKLQLGFETGDLRLHRRPVRLRGDRSPNPGPLAKGHLDRHKSSRGGPAI